MPDLMSKQLSFPELLSENPSLMALARYLEHSGPPDSWLAAGCVVQTLWNAQAGYPLTQGILDYDLVYFDPDLRASTEQRWQQSLQAEFKELKLDVKNQARVYQWYPQKFGIVIAPFESVAAAMSSWPTTATATAARWSQGRWQILAPFGTTDLLAGIVRPNQVLVSKEIYLAKVKRWQALWPHLMVLPWQESAPL